MSTVPNILDNEQGVCCYCSFFENHQKKQQQTFPQETCKVKHFALKNHSIFLFLPIQDHWSRKKVWGVILRTSTTPASNQVFQTLPWRRVRNRSLGALNLRLRNCHDVPKTGELMCQHIRRWRQLCQVARERGGAAQLQDRMILENRYETVSPWWFKVTFLGWLSDPFKGLSDLQLGDEKGTLNHLAIGFWFFDSGGSQLMLRSDEPFSPPKNQKKKG